MSKMRIGICLASSFLLAASLVTGVGAGPHVPAQARPERRAAASFGTLVPATVRVPAGLRGTPFNVSRTLQIPRRFGISVYARVPGARFMVVTPDGNLLVSVPSGGKIVLVRPKPGGNPTVTTFAGRLRQPQG